MTVIKLKETSNYKKFEAIRKAGFDLITNGKGFRLIDNNNSNIENYIDINFRTVDEVLSTLSSYLSEAGYKVVAA